MLIDGGHLRECAKRAGKRYDPALIEKMALLCRGQDEEILRILYYDCALYAGEVRLPVSGAPYQFIACDRWLDTLAQKPLFAVRRGVLKFRGFRPKTIPVQSAALTDDDFKPVFEQKGVDMRIGLDIALYSSTKTVQRIVLLSADTDCVAAMKHGRKAGLQVVIVELPGQKLAPELLAHADFKRSLKWPEGLACSNQHQGQQKRKPQPAEAAQAAAAT